MVELSKSEFFKEKYPLTYKRLFPSLFTKKDKNYRKLVKIFRKNSDEVRLNIETSSNTINTTQVNNSCIEFRQGNVGVVKEIKKKSNGTYYFVVEKYEKKNLPFLYPNSRMFLIEALGSTEIVKSSKITKVFATIKTPKNILIFEIDK